MGWFLGWRLGWGAWRRGWPSVRFISRYGGGGEVGGVPLSTKYESKGIYKTCAKRMAKFGLAPKKETLAGSRA